MTQPVITLITDFGTADSYVGVMKGVILNICPGAAIVDITHDVHPQDIAEGAFLLGTAYRYYSTSTIHVAVVDPGVGSERRSMLLETPLGRFVAPDNGLLSYIIRDAGVNQPRDMQPFQANRTVLPVGCQAYQLTNDRYWLQPISQTFHGRDVFAPVAAHLAMGVPAREMGTPIDKITALTLPIPKQEGNTLVGQVVYVDHFGNLVTNIAGELVPHTAMVEIAGRCIYGLSTSYSVGPPLLAIIGSHGYVEVSIRNSNAAQELMLGAGSTVHIHLHLQT